MSGICSAHRGHDPECSPPAVTATAGPSAVTPLPDDVADEAVVLATAALQACGLGRNIARSYAVRALAAAAPFLLAQGVTLREMVENYLRQQPGWREHPENAHTYLQWEDLAAKPGERFLPTDLAALRQMAREATDGK